MARLTFLGTGTSQGVPVIGCRCEVCTSADKRDNRLRTAAMVEVEGKRIVIDAGPDFRQQMLRENVSQLDAILCTHHHKDHTGGIDDVRAFNFIRYPEICPVDIYATPKTACSLRKDYDYAFAEHKYIGVPELRLHEIDTAHNFEVCGVKITPIKGTHAPGLEVVGYRIGAMAYLTDFKHIEPEEVEKLMGVEHLVVNALRFEPHHSHFNVKEALALIGKVAPTRAYLTHVSHRMGQYQQVEKTLPDGVILAYDGLRFEF
ncbi:MAG: MBL fold metallo-hydrolase [Alistipes sp.]|nr:MBL fold metallo-hydrolase [Alistipes sp.]